MAMETGSTPLRVLNRRVRGQLVSVAITWAVARVACPHRSSSTTGVNHRSTHSSSAAWSRGWAHAVSDRPRQRREYRTEGWTSKDGHHWVWNSAAGTLARIGAAPESLVCPLTW